MHSCGNTAVLQEAGVGPTSGPTWRRSHLVPRLVRVTELAARRQQHEPSDGVARAVGRGEARLVRVVEES